MKCSAHCNHDWVCLKQSKTGLRSSAPWQTRRAGENATRDEKIKLTLMGGCPTFPAAGLWACPSARTDRARAWRYERAE